MLKRKNAILAAAVLGAIPVMSQAAVTFVLTIDPTTLKYGAPNTASSGYTALTAAPDVNGAFYNPATETATVPAGDAIVFGYDGSMAGSDPSANPVTGNGAWGLGLNNSSPSVALPNGGTATSLASVRILNGTNKPIYNSTFSSSNGYAPGTVIHADNKGGGVTGGGIGVGLTNASSVNTPGPLTGLLVSNIEIDTAAGAAGGSTDKFTPTPTGTASFGSYAYLTGVGAGNFIGTAFATSNGDTVNYSAATLTVAIVGAVTSTTSTTSAPGQPIVSLLNTAPTTYGSQIGTPISITGHNGSYTVGNTGANASTGTTTGFTLTSVWNPLTDSEVYALKIDQNGTPVPVGGSLAQQIATDMDGTGKASNVSASAIVPGSTAALLFPGYEVLLTSTGGFGGANANGQSWLGVDFSQDTNTPGLTVTEIAAVPEPATAAGIVLGAAGLLLGRRKSKVSAA